MRMSPKKLREMADAMEEENERRLSDGAVPKVGQRVVMVREVAEKWGLAHGHDDHVHEITSLLHSDTHLVECGPQQIGMAMLRLAPEGSEVTCSQCLGWHERREQWRIDAVVFRETQFEVKGLHQRIAALEAELRLEVARAAEVMMAERNEYAAETLALRAASAEHPFASSPFNPCGASCIGGGHTPEEHAVWLRRRGAEAMRERAAAHLRRFAEDADGALAQYADIFADQVDALPTTRMSTSQRPQRKESPVDAFDPIANVRAVLSLQSGRGWPGEALETLAPDLLTFVERVIAAEGRSELDDAIAALDLAAAW